MPRECSRKMRGHIAPGVGDRPAFPGGRASPGNRSRHRLVSDRVTKRVTTAIASRGCWQTVVPGSGMTHGWHSRTAAWLRDEEAASSAGSGRMCINAACPRHACRAGRPRPRQGRRALAGSAFSLPYGVIAMEMGALPTLIAWPARPVRMEIGVTVSEPLLTT